MRFPALAISLAALAAVILVAYADAPGRSLATGPNPDRFSIDMDPLNSPANTAISLGSLEPCAAMSDDGVLNLDEDVVDTVEFDVTVTGIPASNAAMGAAYSLNYPAPQTRINLAVAMKITGFQHQMDLFPDTNGVWSATELDLDPPYESGSGTLDRVRIEVLTSAPGLYPLTLSGHAIIDQGGIGRAPDATDNAMIQLNAGGCGTYADIEMLSMSLTSANPIPIGSYSPVTADMTVRNNGPQSGNTSAATTFTVPPGCTLNNAGGTVVLNASLGVISPGTSVAHQETPSLRCTSSIGSFVMPVTSCGQVDVLDLVSGNNCMTQNLNFDVVAPPGTDSDSDRVYDLDEFNCGVSTFGISVFPERLNGLDDDGDTAIDEALPPGSEPWDCDGDGYVGTAETHVFGSGQDQDRCGLGSWSADFVAGGFPDSTDRITVTDFTTFIVPPRHLNTNVGDNPGNVRWDLVPGRGPFMFDINVTDLTSLITLKPPMFSGTRAFNGLPCSLFGS